MGLKPHLSQYEKGQIVALYHEVLPIRKIASRVGRDPATISRFLKSHKLSKATRNPRNALKLRGWATRLLIRTASSGNFSASQLRSKLNFSVSTRRVQQVLRATAHLKYRKMLKTPALTPKHLIDLENWARRNIARGDYFSAKVVCSVEKKFNLDSTNSLSYYWNDLRG